MHKKFKKIYIMKGNNQIQNRFQTEANQLHLPRIEHWNSQSQVVPVMSVFNNHKNTKSKEERHEEIKKIQLQTLEKGGIEQIANIEMIGNIEHINMKKEQKMLQKEYPDYKYLPLQYLREIKRILTNYQTAKECKFQSNGESQHLNRVRQQRRLKIVKCIIFSIFQILNKVNYYQMNAKEQTFTSQSLNKLSFSYEIAKQIESAFFKSLFQKSSESKMKEPYRDQISMIIRLFNDKNNLQFRRKILNRQFNLVKLAVTKEEDLQSEKSKEENIKKLQQLVRQNQKVETNNIVIEQQIYFQKPVEDILKLSFNSIKSMSELSQKQSNQDRKKREKEESIKKNKIICKKAYISILKTFRRMSDNINQLKAQNVSNKAFLKLNNLLES